MNARTKSAFGFIAASLCVAASAVSVASYVGNGMAYGDLYGINGSEQELRILSLRAHGALVLALLSEACAIVAVSISLPRADESSSFALPRLMLSCLLCFAGTFGLILFLAKIGAALHL
jgi:hypothetical protein